MRHWLDRISGLFDRTVRDDRDGDALFAGRSSCGQVVYAIGDVHGREDLLVSLLKEISIDVRSLSPQIPVHVILIGDYIDWGPKSREVIETLVALEKYPAWRTHFLKGDHEEVLLRFVERPTDGWHWLERGGHATIASYGVECAYRPKDLVQVRDDLVAAMGEEHLSFLRRLKRYWRLGDYVFAHAGCKPGVPLSDQEDEDLLWMRPEVMDVPSSEAEWVVIHGHTVSKDILVGEHRICIDTGAYVNHKLSAVRILDDHLMLISAAKNGVAHLRINSEAESAEIY